MDRWRPAGLRVRANAPDYAAFHQRFSQLQTRLEEPAAQKKVVVEDLPKTMGANAAVGLADDGSPIVELQLRESFLTAVPPSGTRPPPGPTSRCTTTWHPTSNSAPRGVAVGVG